MKNFLKEWENHFINHRPYLVSFAFRMTGSLAESEELVQDTFLDCAATDPLTISNHRSWLTKICSNKSIDLLRSAYKRRETYVGSWLPDAVPDNFKYLEGVTEHQDLDQALLVSESLTTTFLLLAEKLSPEERVVYILNEVFEYSFNEIADFLNKSTGALRKIAQRARESISSKRVKYTSSRPDSQKIIARFFELAKQQDKAELMDLLSENSEFWSDGGGKVNAIRAVVKDKTQITRFFTSDLMSEIYNSTGLKFEAGMANNLPSISISKKLADGTWTFDTIMTFEVLDNKISRIYSQRNPDKLGSLIMGLRS